MLYVREYKRNPEYTLKQNVFVNEVVVRSNNVNSPSN